jgi:4-amino-4-deoxy-L-arabinose transferase-like glycosyltransferase
MLGPAPQEAYYWNYAQHLDLSYFDHPPMTAYLIYFFTSIFGNNAFGIHFTAIFVSIILSILLFNFIGLIFDKSVAYWSVVVSSTTLIFALGSIIITPDGPLLMFWLLFMMALYRATQTSKNIWWVLSGLFFGAALVSKYTAVFAALGAFLFLLSSHQRRRQFLSAGPYLAMTMAIIVFLPVIVWNYQHDWASFQFQSGRRTSEAVGVRFDYFFGFIGTQIAVAGVFLIPLFIWGIIKAVRLIRNDIRLALLFWMAITTLVFFLTVSPFVYVKMNWLAPAYLSGLALAVYLYFLSSRKKLMNYGKYALIFSALLTAIVHIIAVIPIVGLGKADTINGWNELAARVDQIRNEMTPSGTFFICGYEYKTASELKFHLAGQPEIFSNNIVAQRGLQYDYWCDPDTLIGKNCLFIYDDRNKYRGAKPLAEFFEKLDGPEIISVKRGGIKITDYYIFRGYNYKGIK